MSSLKKNVLIVMFVTILSKLLGFLRDIILSYYYGASNVSDAFLISTTIPITIFSMIYIGITTGYIPVYTKTLQDHGQETCNRFTSNLIHVVLAGSALIIAVCYFFAKYIVKAFAYGFDEKTFNLSVMFTRISLFGILFWGIIYIFTAYLQVNNKFLVATLIGFPFNIVTISAIIISQKIDLVLLPIVSTFAVFIQMIFLIPYVFKQGYRHQLTFNLKDNQLRQMIKIAIPAIIGISVNEVNVIVDRTLASGIVVGGISALNYSNRLTSFIIGIFIAPIITVIYPKLSQLIVQNNIKDLKKTLNDSVVAMSLFVIPCTMALIVFSSQIVTILYGRGEFGNTAVYLTSGALIYYAIGILFLGIREILSRTFYALSDSRTPAINSAISVILNIVLNLILSRFWGINGLALATSISAIFATILLWIRLKRKIGHLELRKIASSLIKIAISSIIMMALCRVFYGWISIQIGPNIALVITALAGMLLYAVAAAFMKIQNLDIIILAIKRKLLMGKARES
jgi:putative peptidoglycan lipid II flippase